MQLFVLILTAALSQPLATPPAAGARPRQPPAGSPAAPSSATAALATQVMLDRAGFSPGAIDGKEGRNTRKALEAYRRNGGDPGAVPADPLTTYTVTEADSAGPYADIPDDLVQQAKLPALTYATPLEALAERFHATPDLLRRLNPSAAFAAGETIKVPDVKPLVPPVERLPPAPKGTRGPRSTASGVPNDKTDVVVTVSKSASALTVRDAADRVVFYAPVTTGSAHDPLPIGEWTVNGVQFNPTFHYNPELFWDADPGHAKATIPAGPNNPVGLVWIDLSKEHYGIHGTPEPSSIGRAESHGCVRLTNWDALAVAGLVKPGTRVLFVE